MGYSSFCCDIKPTILLFYLFYTMVPKEYFSACVNSQQGILCIFSLFAQKLPKRGGRFDIVLYPLPASIFPFDPGDPIDGKTADRANGTNRIGGDDAGCRLGIYPYAGRWDSPAQRHYSHCDCAGNGAGAVHRFPAKRPVAKVSVR